LFWLARAETNALTAIEHLRQAIARNRTDDYLLALGDAQQAAKQFREAAQTYAQLNNEQALQRQAVALHQAKAYAESEQACQRFLQAYPKSALRDAVQLQSAENAYALEQWPEAERRYAALPDNDHARLALGIVRLRLGKPAEAATTLRGLAGAEAYLAECLLRTLPAGGDDALAAARLVKQLEETVLLLETAIAAKTVELPEALMKLGWCQQTLGVLMADGEERNKVIETARVTYKRVQTEFPEHPLFAQSVFERAKCSAEKGDLEKANAELSRFLTDPLQKSPIAPLASARLAVLFRAQGKTNEAVELMAKCRQQYPSAYPDLLAHHHALALKDAGKIAEALAIFAKINTPEAAWRAGQCQKELAAGKPDALRAVAGYFLQVKEPRERCLYEAAWCWRAAGDLAQARAAYEPLRTTEARFELAELSPPKAAIPLLREALDAEPAPDLADKIRLRLGDCLLAIGDPKAAAPHLAAVAKKQDSPLAAEARTRWAEALLAQQDWPGAIKALRPFAEQRVAGIGERALLRLGHAHGFARDWNASRQTLESLINAFPKSVWVGEARYGIAWALQNQNQFDPAVEHYRLVTRGTASELAARAQIQIGLCLLAAKKPAEAVTALQAVPVTYAYPEWSALALCEAARALTETGQKDAAATMLQQVLERWPNTRGAAAAREQLNQLTTTRSAAR
jgi:tetratricopeptide (TPR) repeat protein